MFLHLYIVVLGLVDTHWRYNFPFATSRLERMFFLDGLERMFIHTTMIKGAGTPPSPCCRECSVFRCFVFEYMFCSERRGDGGYLKMK
jgi:hypothetical protein